MKSMVQIVLKQILAFLLAMQSVSVGYAASSGFYNNDDFRNNQNRGGRIGHIPSQDLQNLRALADILKGVESVPKGLGQVEFQLNVNRMSGEIDLLRSFFSHPESRFFVAEEGASKAEKAEKQNRLHQVRSLLNQVKIKHGVIETMSMSEKVSRLMEALNRPETKTRMRSYLGHSQAFMRTLPEIRPGYAEMSIEVPNHRALSPIVKSTDLVKVIKNPYGPGNIHWELRADKTRVLKFMFDNKMRAIEFSPNNRFTKTMGHVFASKKPSQVIDALAQRSKGFDVSWTMGSFLAAMTLVNEAKMAFDYDKHILGRQKLVETVTNPSFAASMAPFAAYQWFSSGEGRQALSKTHRLSKIMGLGKSTSLSMGSMMSNLSFASTRILPLFLISALIYRYGDIFQACQKLSPQYSRALKDPHGGEIGMTQRERTQAQQVCDQGYDFWLKEGMDFFAPILLTGMAITALVVGGPMLMKGLVGAGKYVGSKVGQAGRVVGEKSLSVLSKSKMATKVITQTKDLAAAMGSATKTSAQAVKGGVILLSKHTKTAARSMKTTRVAFDGFRLVFRGGKWLTSVLAGGVGSTILFAVIIGGAEYAMPYFQDQWTRSSLLTQARDKRSDIIRDMDIFRNNKFQFLNQKCEKDDPADCTTTIQKTLKEFHSVNRRWRGQLMTKVATQQEMWLEYMLALQHRYHAAKIFYAQVIEQLQKAKKSKKVAKAMSSIDRIYEELKEGRGDMARYTRSYRSLEALSMAFKDVEVPFLKSHPFFGVGYPIPIEPFTPYITEKEKVEDLERETKLKKQNSKNVGIEAIADMMTIAEKRGAQAKLKETLLFQKERRALTIKVARDFLERELKSNSRITKSERVDLEYILKGLRSKNERFVVRALLFLNAKTNWVNSYRKANPLTEGGEGYVAHRVMNKLGFPSPMHIGERFVHYDSDEILKKRYRIDVNYAPKEYFGKNRSMSHYLVKSMLCGPNVKDADEIVKHTKGWAPEFQPPAIVLGAGERCRNSFGMKLSSTGLKNFADPMYPSSNRLQVSKWTNKRVSGFPMMIYTDVDPKILQMGFEKWWKENVEVKVAKLVKEAEKAYRREVVEKLLNPNIDGQESLMFNANQDSTWWRSQSNLPTGLIPSIRQEITFYFDTILKLLVKNIEFANRRHTGESLRPIQYYNDFTTQPFENTANLNRSRGYIVRRGQVLNPNLYDGRPLLFGKNQRRLPEQDYRIEYNKSVIEFLAGKKSKLLSLFDDMIDYKDGKVKLNTEKYLQVLSKIDDVAVAFQLKTTLEAGDPQRGIKGFPFSRLYLELSEKDQLVKDVAATAIEQIRALVQEAQGLHLSVNAMDAENTLGK